MSNFFKLLVIGIVTATCCVVVVTLTMILRYSSALVPDVTPVIHHEFHRTSDIDATTMTPDQFLKTTMEPKHFTKYQHNFPCFPNKSSYEENVGLFYIKVFKTASSTVSHIIKKISRKRGGCVEHSSHAAAHTYNLQNRTKDQSFLFTFIREPTKRAVSNFFYFQVTQKKVDINVDNFKAGCCQSKLKLNGQAGFQLAYISTQERLPQYSFWNSNDPEKIHNPYTLVDRVNEVFSSYDFIGVSERFNESIVILSFLLNLTLDEIKYVTRKQSGSYVYLPRKKKCVKSVKSQLTTELEQYLQSSEWKAITAGDSLLHRTALEALDHTIDNVIGRDTFQNRLSEYESMMELIQECDEKCLCCSEDGKYREPVSCRSCMDQARSKWKIERND
jgi:hypothetical protein